MLRLQVLRVARRARVAQHLLQDRQVERSVPNVCCVSLGMLYDEPACRSSAWHVVRGSRSISSRIARLSASPIESEPSLALPRRSATCALQVASASGSTVASVTASPSAGAALAL